VEGVYHGEVAVLNDHREFIVALLQLDPAILWY
jgi:hypothetical protein